MRTDPTTYVIDREGIVRHRHDGLRGGGEENEIEAEAKALLAH